MRYGFAAIGAALAAKFAFLITIVNSAAVGANMLISGFFHFVMLGLENSGMSVDELAEHRMWYVTRGEIFFYVAALVSTMFQLLRRQLNVKPPGYGPYTQIKITVRSQGALALAVSIPLADA